MKISKNFYYAAYILFCLSSSVWLFLYENRQQKHKRQIGPKVSENMLAFRNSTLLQNNWTTEVKYEYI